MKTEDLMILGIVVIAIVVGVCSAQYLGPDNVVEEVAEEVILEKTGQSIDLSPGTPER